ncbi:hypothetical protein EAX61_00195 [Dokdonia sinensis]|uniref:Uncharacterized protein n=1 Tax=Dokdonia sinensis TaxID=2479847 RepID=A0A3M0GH17_9FLAO|nr:hypothetical protein [Dokdonia sinensis]RMB63847.1 hypothetical protein EAX61_00195 [Dokdonia sinensis]
MGINQIVTALDSAVLETKEQYEVYFKIVTHAFEQLVVQMEAETICSPLEITYVKQYCDLITYTLEAFRVKYLFDDEEKMKVDLTESGFPNYSEFRYLINDMELKQEHINKLPKIEDLKAEFLETLLRHKEPISDKRMHQAASIVYYKSVESKFLFKRFVQGKVQRTNDPKEPEYMVSWAFYDIALNRPFICFMYFDLHKTKMEDYLGELYKVLESTADRSMTLDTMGYAIDKKLPNLWPKRIKKIDLGPIHNVFAKDELLITHAILKGIVEKTLDIGSYAITVGIEETSSKGNFAEGNIFSKQFLQVWENERPEQYLFSSHRVMQLLYDQLPQYVYALSKDPIEIEPLKL